MRWGLCVAVLAACNSDTAADTPSSTVVFDDVPAFQPDASALGCAGSGGAPSLGDCLTGRFFADCGGFGPARLACKGGDCRWFATTCIAPALHASPFSPP